MKVNEYVASPLVLGLDKLALTVSPTDAVAHTNYYKDLVHIAKLGEELVSDASARGVYKFAARIKIEGFAPSTWPLFQACPCLPGTAYFRLEFNPNRLGADGMEVLANTIETITPQGWALFLHHARATRIDANMDAQGLSLSQLRVHATHPRKIEVWSWQGQLSTIYLGDKEGSDQFYRIYALAPGKIVHGEQAVTRFEAVDKKTKPLLSQLHLYDNPFLKMVVSASKAPKPAGWSEWFWTMFSQLAADHGMQAALNLAKGPLKKQATAALAAAPMMALEMDACWKQWPTLLDKLGVQKAGCHGSYLAPIAAQAA